MEKADLSILRAELLHQRRIIDMLISKIDERKRDYVEDPRFTESLAYQVHNLYCAFEDLFQIVAKFFENNIEDASRYHIELLRRMTLDIDGVRPALISRELSLALDEIRAFRHVFRHAYSYELDPDKLALVLRKVEYVKQHYATEIDGFLHTLTPPSVV